MDDKKVKTAQPAEVDPAAIIAEQSAMIEALNAVITEQKEMIEALSAEILQGKSQLQELNDYAVFLQEKSEKVVATSGLQVTHNKKNYLVKHGVFLAGKNYTAADIAEDKAVLSRLIEGKSSAVEAV